MIKKYNRVGFCPKKKKTNPKCLEEITSFEFGIVGNKHGFLSDEGPIYRMKR